MGKGRAAIAVVVIGLVVIGAIMYFLPSFLSSDGFGGEMSVQFFKDGKAVTAPNSLSFVANGVGIDEVRVTLGWTATGDTGIDISVKGTVKLYWQSANGGYLLLDSGTFLSNAYAAEDSIAFMIDGYPELDPQEAQSWTLKVTGLLEATARYADGSVNEATWPADGTPKEGIIDLAWSTTADTKTFTLDGYWSY